MGRNNVIDEKILEEINKRQYYNREQKINYLVQLEYDIYGIRQRAFFLQKAREVETIYDKDLMFFNVENIDTLMKSLRYTNVLNIQQALETFIDYKNWTVKEQIVSADSVETTNLFEVYKQRYKGKLDGLISDTDILKKYLSEDELDLILNTLDSNRDVAIVLSLYEGIRGAGMHELRSLKLENLNQETNVLRVYDKEGQSRDITISDRLKRALNDANDDKYLVLMGDDRIRMYDNTPYVIRSASYRGSEKFEDKMISMHTINSILKNIRNNYEGAEFITAKNLEDSGIYNRILRAYNDDKIELEYDDVSKVLKDYNFQEWAIYKWIRRAKELMEILKQNKL